MLWYKYAGCLKECLAGTYEGVSGIVIDKPVCCFHETGQISKKERSKAMYLRAKLRKAGVLDVLLLRKAVQKLTKREFG
ncbi:hypothetical protein OCOJLMKI_2993 [Methylobacterium iners]|uniref:Uncharacterized protein n=1 Tax=Methylobacterium iners TaxID=418707 RepID=A0ABQ4RZZ1_9HYPH|nr:hypothetical protein OCOJLMKI_2993 [Methylobacterium iners]